MSKDRIVMPSVEKAAFGDQLPPKQVSWRSQMPQFVVEVDGQAKSGFVAKELADAEAHRISSAFPKLQVRVVDWQSDSVTNLGPTKAPVEAEEEADEA